MKVRLYYAQQLVKQWDELPGKSIASVAHEIYHDIGDEIYQGGYLRLISSSSSPWRDWVRPDLTPVLTQDVPKEVRVLDLLLGA